MERIVFIEDAATEGEVIRRLYEMCQKTFRGEVDFQICGKLGEAILVIESRPPDVILMDMRLPDSSEAESEKVIAEKFESWPPIIVLTGSEDKELRRRCLLAGADDYMDKKTATRDPVQLCERMYNAHLRRLRSTVKA